MTPKVKDFTLVSIILLILSAVVVYSANGANLKTARLTVPATPIAIGEGMGRSALDIKNTDGSASLFCGPASQDNATWWEIDPGEVKRFGVHPDGTGSVEIMCNAASTPVVAHISEEGMVRDFTATATPTDTPTATPTDTPTPTATPTDTPTATPTDTP